MLGFAHDKTPPPTEQQSTHHVVMIRPVRFVVNTQTAIPTLPTQGRENECNNEPSTSAQEFDALVANLRKVGVCVHVFADTPEPHKPDSIFPNNWVAHADVRWGVFWYQGLPSTGVKSGAWISCKLEFRGFRIKQTIDLNWS